MRLRLSYLARLAVLTSCVAAFAAAGDAGVAGARQHRHHHRGHAARMVHLRSLRPLTVGFSAGADGALASGNARTQNTWVPRAQRLGAQMVRLEVYWSRVAPADPSSGFLASDPASPGYDWSTVDEQVRELAAAHFQILITVRNAPTWAEGHDMPNWAVPGTWKPSAAQFGEFAQAIATRYDGRYHDPLNSGLDLPKVSFWQGWNEPNLTTYLAPQWKRGRTRRWVPVSPGIYRNLENSFYRAIKHVSKSNFVVAAGTGPYGGEPGGTQMQPVAFDRALFCLNQSLRRARGCKQKTYLDAIDNHPYGIGGPNWHAYNRDDVAVPDVYKLTRVLSAAQRTGAVLPKGHKGVWTTEIAWDTNPPDPNGVPTNLEARWLEQAFYVLWRQGVGTILWWQLVDSPPVPNYASSYQGGVYLLKHAKAKPSATSYRFPFVGIRRTARAQEVWGRAPTTGTMAIQRRRGRRWITVVDARVHARQVFELSVPFRGKGELRATIGRVSSLAWPVRP